MVAELHPQQGRVAQQDIEAALGVKTNTVCAQTSFYLEARRLGYPAGQLEPAEFVGPCLQRDEQGNIRNYSKRAELSACVRERHSMRVVSWNTVDQPQDTELMRQLGYLQTDEEIQFFRDVVEGHSVIELLLAGHHIIAGMAPGFGPNKAIHAVVLQLAANQPGSEGQMIEVVDPDERNSQQFYTVEEIQRSLQPGGACSIVLPPEK